MVVVTIMFLIGLASFAKCFHFAIQKGQFLDTVLNWQEMLRQHDIKGNSFLWHVLGGCEMCFCHFISFLSIPVYLLVLNSLGYLHYSSFVTVVITFFYDFTATILNVYFVCHLFAKE